MATDLQWQDALAAVNRQVFSPQERAQGWSGAFTLSQVANLQRPWMAVKGDPTRRRPCDALFHALLSACAAGEIECSTTARRVMVAPAQTMHPPVGAGSWATEFTSWPAAYTVGGVPRAYTRPAVFRDEVEHRIATGPFLAWLAAQGEEPSAHVRAWAKSQGAALRLVESPPAPLVDLQRTREAGATHPAAAVPPWKRADGTWTDEAKAEMARLREAEKLTDQQIGERFGVSRTNITRVIGSKLANKAKESSSRKASGQ